MTGLPAIALGVLTSALAQIFIKRAAAHAPFSQSWLGWMGGSALSYAASFVLYSIVLRRFALSTVGPVMTVAVMCTVVLAGLLMGEALGPRQWIGLALGVGTVVAILG